MISGFVGSVRAVRGRTSFPIFSLYYDYTTDLSISQSVFSSFSNSGYAPSIFLTSFRYSALSFTGATSSTPSPYCIIQRYSFYRLRYGYKWWPDEQPSPEIKKYVENQLAKREINVVFSHTCPSKYIPTECFLSGVDQSKVDNSTEEWLDTIEDKLEYEAWYLGHWHTDKRIDKLHFLFHGIETL